MTSLEERFWAKVDRRHEDECWPWTASLTTSGYGQIQAWTVKGWRPVACSRVAYALTYGDIPEASWVLHSCDNPPCCNPAHLRLGTPADNAQDRVDRGRVKGPPAKLSDSQVREIRCRAGTEGQSSLAREFGVTPSLVCRIVNGHRRRSVV